jgi:hypothetical protein
MDLSNKISLEGQGNIPQEHLVQLSLAIQTGMFARAK